MTSLREHLDNAADRRERRRLQPAVSPGNPPWTALYPSVVVGANADATAPLYGAYRDGDGRYVLFAATGKRSTVGIWLYAPLNRAAQKTLGLTDAADIEQIDFTVDPAAFMRALLENAVAAGLTLEAGERDYLVDVRPAELDEDFHGFHHRCANYWRGLNRILALTRWAEADQAFKAAVYGSYPTEIIFNILGDEDAAVWLRNRYGITPEIMASIGTINVLEIILGRKTLRSVQDDIAASERRR